MPRTSCYFLRVPLVRIALMILALTQVVGLADAVLGDACGDVCTDDGCASDCPPGIACHCHCPSAIRAPGVVEHVATIEMPTLIEAFGAVQQAHANPDPREILHVPKPAV